MRLLNYFFGCIVASSLLLPVPIYAFCVNKIEILGLQGISRDTVLSYLPVRIGQSFGGKRSSQLIKALYATGFFSNIQLEERANTLIIKVIERPILREVELKGNKEIPKDKLNEITKKIGLVPGGIFDKSILDRFVLQLQSQYESMGKYAARVTYRVVPKSNNTVAIHIDIAEGLTVQVGGISILGNHAFSERKLLSVLPLSANHISAFFTNADRYNQSKFIASSQALQAFYLDRGYLKFKLDASQVTLTPDRKIAYLIFRVNEGPRYVLKGYQLAGKSILSKAKLQTIMSPLKKGKIFSREKILAVEGNIKKALGDLGYIFATVNTLPEIDDQNKSVFLTFYMAPGNLVYVRHINISGNIKTQDEVYRRLLHQQEGSLISEKDIRESLRQLSLTGFLEGEPQITPIPVPATTDKVDLELDINEAHAAQALFTLGYGTNGPLIGTSLNQNNVFGTGNQLGINFNNSRAATVYSVSYNNPFYTLDGIQRGFDVFYQHSTPNKLNTTSYSTNVYGGNVHYYIPFDARGDVLQLSGGLQKLQLNLPPYDSLSKEVQSFVNKKGTDFNQLLFTIGWSRNELDRLFFPQKGWSQNAAVQIVLPAGGTPLQYYDTRYAAVGYYPLGSLFKLQGRISLAYGNGFGSTKGLPFFANYYVGGTGTGGAMAEGQVRGYEMSSLGPKDSNHYPLGGNEMVTGSLALILPTPPSLADKIRTSWFVDVGNVYSSLGVTEPNHPRGGTSSGPLRYSSGLNVDWRLPVFGVTLSFSLTKALNAKPGDQTQTFQFNIGTGL